jgi:Peptidase propeptide and YPEB domain
MSRSIALPSVLVLLLGLVSPVLAGPPPENARPLSEILRSLEQQGDFAYFDEIEWDDEDDYWEIDYVTRNGGTREIEVDPVSGQIRN